MKRYIIFPFLIVLSGLMFSCQDYSVTTPDACVSTSKLVDGKLVESATFSVGESVIITSCGDADLLSVWNGDEGSDYSKKDERGVDAKGNVTWPNQGTALSVKEGSQVIKIYNNPGTYTITLVATNTSTGSTNVEFKVAIAQETIIVTP